MKKFFSLLLSTCVLAACAGNPPAWWNPNNRYGSVDDTVPVQPAAQEPKTTAEEENIAPLPDVSYEEVTLTPLSDEENENETGASSAQNEENLPVPSVLD